MCPCCRSFGVLCVHVAVDFGVLHAYIAVICSCLFVSMLPSSVVLYVSTLPSSFGVYVSMCMLLLFDLSMLPSSVRVLFVHVSVISCFLCPCCLVIKMS